MRISDKWWTCPAESENGRTVIVTGRDDLDAVMKSGKYKYRIDVTWSYNSLSDGMPEEADGRLMEQATDALLKEFKKNPVGIMTGIYTGDGKRDWVFYTLNLRIFSSVFNRALESLPLIPLVIEAEEDAEWGEYKEMREMTYIPEEE